jgi:hypothetical protein
MRYVTSGLLAVSLSAFLPGCSTKVETTEDSTRVEAEGPKIEVGDQPVDLDPSTDADVDVDTPAPGDN